MKRYVLIAVSLILCVLFLKLLHNYSECFDYVERGYMASSSVNLGKGVTSQQISTVFLNNNYMTDKEDADFVACQLVGKLDAGQVLSELSDLNKRTWQLSHNLITDIGSMGFRQKLADSQYLLGADDEFHALDLSSLDSCAVIDNRFEGKIEVHVKAKNNDAVFIKRYKDCAGVAVRLSMHIIDSLTSAPERITVSYLKTGENGKVVFKGLDPELSYSVLPIKIGYEYGASKGTLSGSLSKSGKKNRLSFLFTEREHSIRIFDTATLKQIKDDKVITVRSPKEFKDALTTSMALFFLSWLGLFAFRKLLRKMLDPIIYSMLMLLTGLCLLTMFSINEPLTDKLIGVEMSQGIVIGVIIIAFVQNVDVIRFYQDRYIVGFDIPLNCILWIFKPFRLKVSVFTDIMTRRSTNSLGKYIALLMTIICMPLMILDLLRITKLYGAVEKFTAKFPKGTGYLLMAVLLTVSLFLFGSEVGGMKVNLNLLGIKFQPSEISKYLTVFFVAAFFSVNADSIVKYSEEGNAILFVSKLKLMLVMISGLGLLMFLYLLLGDMGPAIILAFTFIIMYSIIKSKVDIEEQGENKLLMRVFTCDLAMLLYGVVSFIVCIYLGNLVGGMGVFCIGWFIVWILIGLLKRQIFESAILFNLIITAFLFAGNLLEHIPQLQSTAERLGSRNEMCINTWGILPVNGMYADAGENTQVAEGLWGLASGGLTGQGLGNGSPYYIPAYHTDMILESIGEQIGFAGILLILLSLTVLLRRTILAGYRTSHPFPFYLSLGIAIVTAVQFIIISLGSLGILPLTGVTVPFISYGRVSMILNLSAFGVILAISNHLKQDELLEENNIVSFKKHNIGKYNYPVSILSWMYVILTMLICGIFFYYQFAVRNRTLIRPVYVHNSDGVPVVEYNPRIAQLTKKMYAGDIYDRNGILLATSEKSHLSRFMKTYSACGLASDTLKNNRRYYPFGKHLYFMLGDYNSMQFFSSVDKSPRGYMAEARHLSELRGYDNVLRGADGKPVRVDLVSDEYRPGRFFPICSFVLKGLQLRDYSALVPYLKAGINSDKVKRLNGRNTSLFEIETIKPKDIHLTLDARLQTELQQRMEEYMKKNYSGEKWNKVRASVVVLDSKNGDLLASANYPLPDYDVLKTAPERYSDNGKDNTWRAYTDMDIGLLYPTAPGSTAKVMSSLAALRKEGKNAVSQKYYVDVREKIFNSEPVGSLDMKEALRWSSNCYFINLINDMDLYDELAFVYANAGVNVSGRPPYVFQYLPPDPQWTIMVTEKRESCVNAYNEYRKSGVKKKMNVKVPLEWSWAWGQNGIDATPAAMARIISVAANGGKMAKTRYLQNEKVSEVEYVDSFSAKCLNDYLKYTAKKHDKFTDNRIGGKTGTPERAWTNARQKINDGWYICFIENANIKSMSGDKAETIKAPIAIAVRLERINDSMSGKAVSLTKEVVYKVLKDLEYL